MANRVLLVLWALLSLSAVSHALVGDSESTGDVRLSLDRRIWEQRFDILKGIQDNISYVSKRRESAWPVTSGPSRLEVLSTLRTFEELLQTSQSFEQLLAGVQRRFVLRPASGYDGRGTVRFTGYFQPSYRASRCRGGVFQYPIYSLPDNFKTWQLPHPTRVSLEGYEGKGNSHSPLYGREIAWLSNRWEAFMIHVQGSALLEMEDGSTLSIGFAGGTEYPFRGISKSYLSQKRVAWNALGDFFKRQPWELNALLAKNNRFIFFRVNESNQPMGSIGVPVIAERSIATDKLAMPPGALSVVFTKLPEVDERGALRVRPKALLVLDQDTGSAIKGPGRVDIFMGSGPNAQAKANHVFSHGELYFLVAPGSSARLS